MNDICKSDANQLNAPAVFKHFLVKNKKFSMRVALLWFVSSFFFMRKKLKTF